MKKYVIILIVLAIVIFGFYNKSKISSNVDQKQKIFKVGISQPISHPGIDVVREGIVTGFANGGYIVDNNIIFDFQNGQGDASISQSIASKFANSDYDIFIPIGTQPSQLLANLIKDKPIVFATVTDPITAGLVTSMETPGANITGTSDMILFKQQLELLKQLKPDTVNVGVVYNPGESNSQFGLQEATKYADILGFKIVTAPANNTGEVLAAARSLVNKVDAFYMIPDNTIAAGQESLIKVAIEAKKILICIEQSGVEKGALATVGINYGKVGELTAELAIRVLQGEEPGKIPVQGIKNGDLFINSTTATKIGLAIPQDIQALAKQVYQ